MNEYVVAEDKKLQHTLNDEFVLAVEAARRCGRVDVEQMERLSVFFTLPSLSDGDEDATRSIAHPTLTDFPSKKQRNY